ncbi:MAG TPA: Lpg1974 family pore-forming outer membrane protein [Rhizomicrobium sp.]|nr:Lpg1974 family pore-forming outer membrane protein [Rhizomicrobium sp.]
MSELINTQSNRAIIRWKLLTGVSALALTAHISSTGLARAEDSDHPQVWIELGGQMEMMQGISSPFSAPFMFKTPTPGPYYGNIFTDGQKPPHFALGLDGKISFQPKESDWSFSVSLRYRRSSTNRHLHHQTHPTFPSITHHIARNYFDSYADMASTQKESHTIVDFSVGRDVGLGLFGHDGSSTIHAGVRFAQFSSSGSAVAYARPSIIPYFYFGRVLFPGFYGYSMHAQAQRKFHGVGPSLSWDVSAALAGNKQDGELTLDWNINGALLFGRQRTKLNHTTHAYYLPGSYYGAFYVRSLYMRSHPADRSRSVTVPNLGGSIGLSVRYPNVKISLGYRYDTFLGAMDTGIDVRKTADLTFNGPYASISIGLGG